MKEVKYPELLGEMAKHGESQRTLANLLGVSHASVSRKLSGKTKWTIGDVEKICDISKAKIFGKHNHQNMMCAVAIAEILNISNKYTDFANVIEIYYQLFDNFTIINEFDSASFLL